MNAAECHEIAKRERQIAQLEREVERLVNIVAAQADELVRLRMALQGTYDLLPRWSCKATAPDGCAVCVARAFLEG